MKELNDQILLLINSSDKELLEKEAEKCTLPLSTYARYRLLKNLKGGILDDEKTI